MSQEFKPKQFLRPTTQKEMSEILLKFGERCKILAGGTGIYELSYRGLLGEVEVLADISALGLSEIALRADSGSLAIGASVTMHDLSKSNIRSRIVGRLGSIIDALIAIQPLQVKNVATIGGSICTALPFFDLPIALVCLRGMVEIAPSGRTMAISDFIRGYFNVDLKPGEFVKSVLIPSKTGDGYLSGSAFKKFALTGDDWAIVNCGASVDLNKDGDIAKCILAFGGGVGEKPVIASLTARSIEGIGPLEEAKLKDSIESNLPKELVPVTDIRASSEYRMQVVKVICRRSVQEAFHRARSSLEKSLN